VDGAVAVEVVDGIENGVDDSNSVVLCKLALCEDAVKQLSATNKFKGERHDVGVVKAGEEVDLCPDAGFVSLYIFFLITLRAT